MTDLSFLPFLDRTLLDTGGSDQKIDALCEGAIRDSIAAICIWPQFVSRARQALHHSTVKVATIANFPHGTEDLERVIDGIQEALDDGAQEIDCVFPYHTFLSGKDSETRGFLEALRDVTTGFCLKIVLETEAYPDPQSLRAAASLVLETGADFLKTSTGRSMATPQINAFLLNLLKDKGGAAGLKISGSIKTAEQASGFLNEARTLMGEAWLTPSRYRIGSSSL